MYWLHLRLNLGLSIKEQLAHLADTKNWGPYAAMFQLLSPAEGGVLRKLQEPALSPGSYLLDNRYSQGERVKPNQSLLDVVYSCVFWNADYEQLFQDFLALDYQKVVEFAPTKTEAQANNVAEPPVNIFTLFNKYISAVIGYTEKLALDYAKSVKDDCPNYFPAEQPNYWATGTSSTFFQNANIEYSNASLIEAPQIVRALP